MKSLIVLFLALLLNVQASIQFVDQVNEDGCTLVKGKLFCSKVTSKCPQLGCDKLKEITYNLSKLKTNSFSNYQVLDELTINLNNLNLIEQDAFNGMIIDSNAHLIINIWNDNDITHVQQQQQQQLKSNLIISENALRHMLLTSNARLNINIRGFDLVEFKAKSLIDQIQLSDSSQVTISIENSNHVLFRSSSSSIKTELNRSLLAENVQSTSIQFKLNILKCNEIIFEKESFSSQLQSASSVFQLTATEFEHFRLGRFSFANIKQSESAYFAMNLSGKRLTLSETAFSSLNQAAHANFILNANITDSSVCLKANTFGQIIQSPNSTVRVSFQLNDMNDFILKKEAISQLNQNVTSSFQIYVLRPFDVQLEGESISQLKQNKSSVFEIWVNKASSNFIIEQNAFFKVTQDKESSIRIGFKSSTDGFYYQSANAFSQFVSANDSSSQVAYELSPGSNFSLKFPLRPIPRILLNMDSKTNLSIEEQIYKMFPKLGRNSRPDMISLNEYKLEANDFCSIAEIPFDMLVKLPADTECSCSVYFLYRSIRNIRNDTDKWLLNTPICYQNKLKQNPLLLKTNNKSTLNEQKDLKTLEGMCKFKELVNNCRIASKRANIQYQKNTFYLKDCDSSFDFFETDQYSINGESYEYVDDSSVDADDNADGDFFNNNYDYKDDQEDDEDENDDDDDDDEYVDDDNNNNNRHIVPIDSKEEQDEEEEENNNENEKKTKNKELPAGTGSMQLSSVQIVFITILSMFLFGMLVAVFIVFRMNRREQSKSVRTTEESDDEENDNQDEDDDDDDDNDDNDLVVNTRKLKGGSIFKPIRNKIEKQKKMIAYSIFNTHHQSNSGLSTLISTENEYFNTNINRDNNKSNNKSLMVQCDRKNSITSSLTDSKNSTQKKIYNSKEDSNQKNKEISIDNKIQTNYNIYN